MIFSKALEKHIFWKLVLTCLWKRHHRFLRGLFFLHLTWNITFFKYKNGGVGPKNFIVELLKSIFRRLSGNIFLGSRSIRICEKSNYRLLRGWFVLNLTGNVTFLIYKNGRVDPKIFYLQLLKWSFLTLSRNIFFVRRWICVSEKSHRKCLRGSFLLSFTGNITFI